MIISHDKTRIDALITLATRVAENSLANPEIMAAFAPYGYDEAALTDFLSDVTHLQTMAQLQVQRRGEQFQATAALQAARAELHRDRYAPHVAIVRIVFKDEPTRKRLGATGKRPARFTAFLQSARRFYQDILGEPELLEEVETRGLTGAAAEAALVALDELEDLHQDREAAIAVSQQATRDREAHRKVVAASLSDIQRVAKLALRDRPDLGEQLGILARS